MIQNLNRLSFLNYGRVLSDRLEYRGFPHSDDYQEQILAYSGSNVAVCRVTGSELYLDFEDGMTILAVSESPEESMVCFYLDKPVCLKAGICFAIIPYRECCTVRMSRHVSSGLLLVAPFRPAEDFKLRHKLRLREIYTIFYQEKERGFFFKGEKHDILELTYVDKGRLHSVVGGNDYLLEQGDLMLYGSDQWHMQYADMDCETSFLTVTFDMDNYDLSALYNRKFCLSSQSVGLVKALVQECERDDPFCGDMVLSLLTQLLVSVLRAAESGVEDRLKTPTSIHNENEIVNRALCYIAENVYSRLSVTAVARAADVSPSHLTSLFHKCMQISPGEYIRRTRLQESKALIREGQMNFTQIAALLQYSTVHHFSRQFKDAFGITPSEYAKAIR